MDEEGWSMLGVWNEMHTQGVFVMGPQHRSVLVSKLVSGVEGDVEQGREEDREHCCILWKEDVSEVSREACCKQRESLHMIQSSTQPTTLH